MKILNYVKIHRTAPTRQPAQINLHNFRNQLIDDWKSCVNFIDEPTSIVKTFNRIKTATTFDELIQLLSEVDSNVNIDEETQTENIDTKWKYEIIRRIGAPWNWIYQFVNHYQPCSFSYNFYECQHKLEKNELLESTEMPAIETKRIAGVNSTPIPIDVRNTFMDYIQLKATENDGMVFSKMFEDQNCPPLC